MTPTTACAPMNTSRRASIAPGLVSATAMPTTSAANSVGDGNPIASSPSATAATAAASESHVTTQRAVAHVAFRPCSSRQRPGAVCMADGYARVSARLPAVSVHQGPGLTNAITGLTEAAKSRTPLIVLAADTPAAPIRSNFQIDQGALVAS